MMYEYTLTDLEQKLCTEGSEMRYNVARTSGVSNGKIGPQSNKETDLLGLGGELATARWLNVYPDLTIYARQGGVDLVSHSGINIDVKTTKYRSGRLITPIHKNITGDLFALMIGKFPNYIFKGFMSQEKLIDDSNIGNLGYGPTYMANQDELRDLKDIRNTGETIS